MMDTLIAIGVVLVILGGSSLDSPDMLIPISITVIGGLMAAIAGIGRG